MDKIFRIFFLFPLSFFLVSCGGDETEPVSEATSDTTAPEVKPEKAPIVEEVEEEVVVLPNPNGVYLPNGEEQNGKPVFVNGEGFFMWFNGSIWSWNPSCPICTR